MVRAPPDRRAAAPDTPKHDPGAGAKEEDDHMDIPQERKLVTEIPGPRSREWFERRAAAVPQGVGAIHPIVTARASNAIVEDVDGNRLIDLGSGIAVTSVGASHPRVVRAVQEQAARFTHTCFMVTPYEGYVAVAERLNALAPGDHEKRSVL
jgi:4-aminobutyrate aminotransferase/(S)-3-amino-2-methylpropionate transaminase